MEIRQDFEDIQGLISRLLNYGTEFSKNIKDWIHYKSEEDFKFVCRIPESERHIVEAVYCDGRDMAYYMSSSLAEINFDFTKFPTLTSIVNGFDDTWVFANYDSEVPDKAIVVCEKHGENFWSVNQMCSLFRNQEKLLAAIRVTLSMLKNTNHYKLENGDEIVSDKANIIVTGNDGSNISIQSSQVQQSTTTEYSEPAIFSQMLEAISASGLDKQAESELVDNTQMLAANHKSGEFAEAYKDFMQNVSAHITVFAPLLGGLAALL